VELAQADHIYLVSGNKTPRHFYL